ncbi:hypothetical protein [Nibrella saemangeumensis]
MIRAFLLLFGLLPLIASAQTEIFFNQPGMQRNGTTPTTSEVILLQSGQLNQIRYSDSGTGNKVSLQQQGASNVLDLDLSGSDNQYSFAQQGDNNRAQWWSGQNNSVLDVLQRGNNNLLVQDGGSPASGVPMRIEQTGGMQLVIKNGFIP